jgi:DNA polymerase III subunit alpha
MKVLKKVDKQFLKDFLYDLDIRDENIYKEANNPNMLGIFQLTAGTAKMMVEKIKPKDFDELNACNAFSRPGTMDFVDQYVENRETKKSPYPQVVSELISDTNSIILYQEQVMNIFNKIGGFTLEETNELRGLMKVLSKTDKKKEDLDRWDEIVKRFQKGSQEKGISVRDAKLVADDLLKMSSYSFNKSHSTSYTYIAVMTLYLSYYFRKFFYSSVLNYEVSREKYLLDRLRAVKIQGFEIIPPDINNSKEELSPIKDTNQIIFGLQNVKFVGEKPAQVIVENQPYKNFVDFYMKIKGNRITIRALTALGSIGAFDSLYPNRKKFLFCLKQFWDKKGSISVKEKLDALWEKIEKNAESIPGLNTEYSDLRQYEKEFLGFNFFVTPFTDDFMGKIYELEKRSLAYSGFGEVQFVSRKVPIVLNSMRVFNDRNGNEMAMLEIEDFTGERIVVPVFQSYWRVIKNEFVEGRVHMINLYLNKKQSGETQIMMGKSGWPKDHEIRRMIKRLDNV